MESKKAKMKKECCIETLKQVEEWLKERTFVKILKEGEEVSLVRFMPFEWAEFKAELIGSKK